MQAIRVHPSPSDPPYSPTNPAPSTALEIDKIPIPTPTPAHLLIRVKATTIIRDMLTWPEIYAHPYTIPGNDFSGIVADTPTNNDSIFNTGDHVFGMAHANRGSTWAEYTLVKTSEVARKPAVSFEEAAALPLSAQTAYEALFVHAGLALPSGLAGKAEDEAEKDEKDDCRKKRVLITGAAGGVGICLVQLAALAGVHVVAASGSDERNGEFLRGLGADEVVEYGVIRGEFDVVVDCVGGGVLEKCWGFVKDGGVLVSVDSASFNFVEEHRKSGISREGVNALFFIVEGSAQTLSVLADLVDRGRLRSFVAASFPIERAREAYDYANGRFEGRGKVVLTI
jgi:NADPH:quinone reductase-like Zn-dependent oxidoreductase